MEKPHTRPMPTARSAISSTASGTSGRCWYSTTSIRAGACVFGNPPPDGRHLAEDAHIDTPQAGTGRAAVAQGLPRGTAPRGICAHAPRRVAHAPPHSAYRVGRGKFRRHPRRPGTGKDIATARARPANQADTRGQPPVVSRRQNVVSRQQNKDAPTTSNGKRPSAEPGAPQARQREPIAPPGNAPAKASAGDNEIGIRHIPSTKKVPSGTFPILPFHRHTLRAVRCRTPGRNP